MSEAVQTKHSFILDCDANAKQPRVMVPYVVGEPFFVTLLRGYLVAKAAQADETKIARALAKRLLAIKDSHVGCDIMYGTTEAPTLGAMLKESALHLLQNPKEPLKT